MVTEAQAFPHLFSPIKLGPFTFPHRVYFGPHGKNFAENGRMGDRHAAYWVDRVKGGINLIITEVETVHPTSTGGRSRGSGLENLDDSVIPAYRRVTSAVHAAGGRIICQIAHHGNTSHRSSIYSTLPLWGPSPVRGHAEPWSEVPKTMEMDDIGELIQAFRQAAARAVKGGFDGVEVHWTFQSVLHNFLSPATNKRRDSYGGSLENRMRLLFEVIEAVRGAVGRNVIVGTRSGGDEDRRGGLGMEEVAIVCRNLAASGLVDYINTTMGNHDVTMTVAPMAVPWGYQRYIARAIKAAAKEVPVFTVGRYTSPEQIERVLAEGEADMVGLVRALIADPEFVNKAQEGRTTAIRPCTGANSCLANQGAGVGCIHNPSAGRERLWGIGTLLPAVEKKRVMVVGGGPAGLETAVTAAQRGHQVDLYEREAELGGQVNLAVRQPYRQDLGAIVGWRVDQLKALGVEVHLNTEVTPAMVAARQPDVVVIATGSRPDASGFSPIAADVEQPPGADQPNVFTAWEVLRGKQVPGKTGIGNHVVVLDDNCHHEAAGTIEFLLDQGKHVEAVTHFNTVGAALGATLEEPLIMQRVRRKGLVLHHRSWVRAIEGNSVRIYDIDNDEERVIEDVDSVVLVTGKLPNESLYLALKEQVKELYRIGDCLAPRLIDNAIYEAHALARQI